MLNIQQQIDILQSQFDLVEIVDLDYWSIDQYEESQQQLIDTCARVYQSEYKIQQRIVFSYTRDYYTKEQQLGIVLKNLQIALNEQDISNFFVVVLSTNPNLLNESVEITQLSKDPIAIIVLECAGEFDKKLLDKLPSTNETYKYGSSNPIKIGLNELTDSEKFLLTKSKTFCMYPWIHLHAYPTGEAYPCCHAEMRVGQIGNCRTDTLKEIWNSTAQKQLRLDMLTETPNATCGRCYEQEKSGFFSGRQSANKHHGHHVARVEKTNDDGTLDQFEMTYWDIRFSNLCNLKCRSCGHIFSSQWYQDQAKLAGGSWKEQNTVLNYAGRTETDIWEQLIPHLDYVEQIYFAGGEPLLMEEHYHILDELVKRGRFDVRLIYNTNFTQTDLKGKSVFEYWKQFKSVAVGASLDASSQQGEYIRKGTKWSQVEANRRKMLEICPEVDFYISPTLSIMNAWHLPDFHREWVDKGLIRAQDLNVNILQDPLHYRIDIAPKEYKDRLREKYQEHIKWLDPLDNLRRASVGFESAINFMDATDNTHLIDTFWRKTHELDGIRNERCLDVIPELKALL